MEIAITTVLVVFSLIINCSGVFFFFPFKMKDFNYYYYYMVLRVDQGRVVTNFSVSFETFFPPDYALVADEY